MTSSIFSEEEARFLRLVLKLAERPHDDKRASWMPFDSDKIKSVGEFRVLVIGAKGVGKTSLLNQFCTGRFPEPSTLPSSNYVHGCRRNINIDSSLYTVDALELPADHLSSPEHLRQALAITEAAVLVYDMTNSSSLTYLKSLSSPIYEALHRPTTCTPTKKRAGFPFTTSTPTRAELAAHPSRPYHFLLLGAKNDVAPGAREISWLEGHSAAGEFLGPHGVAGGASASFLEVSALTGDNVAAVFPLLGREVLRSRRERRAQQEGGAGGFATKRRYGGQGPDGGAWECSDFDFADDDDDDDGDASADCEEGCDCADGGRPLRGSVKRRWCAFKATLTRGFGRECGK